MQVYVRLVNDKQGCRPVDHHERQHLTPDLKAKTGPKDFPIYPLLWAVHSKQRFGVRRVYLRLFDVHSRPRCLDKETEVIEGVWKVMPDISDRKSTRLNSSHLGIS